MRKLFSRICFTFAFVTTFLQKAPVCYDKSTYLKTNLIFGFSVLKDLEKRVSDFYKNFI